MDGPLRGRSQTVQQLQQQALPRAVRPHDDGQDAAEQGQIDVVNDPLGADAQGDFGRLQGQ